MSLLVPLIITALAGNIEDQLISTQDVVAHERSVLEEWQTNFSRALKEAKEAKKPLLVAFLGPNWCDESYKLENEVLADKYFLRDVKQDVILVRVDIPEDYDETSFSGKEIKEHYNVDQCPSLVLVEPSGREIAKLVSLPLDSSQFSLYIKQMLRDYNRVSQLEKKELKQLRIDEIKSLYVKAGRLADQAMKSALLDQGLKVDRGSYFLLEKYGHMLTNGESDRKINKVRKKILKRSSKNQDGYQRKLALMDFNALAHVKKPKKASSVIKPLVSYLETFGGEDPENAWQLEMTISQYLFSKDCYQDALKHAKASLELAPEEARGEITQSIEYLQGFIQ